MREGRLGVGEPGTVCIVPARRSQIDRSLDEHRAELGRCQVRRRLEQERGETADMGSRKRGA